ncbi:MAG: cell division protein FtsH, partial [Synechococcaceae bacterium WB9_4xC_028]|nr:cell division protein FtsH [Synechococcaceae bacterium WB9_4xC_028]
QMLVSRAQLRARIMGALGGRAAEDVVFGHAEVTTGAGGDIQQVASIARQMVTRFGMSEVGQLSLEAGNQEVFLGRDLMTRSDGSDATAARVDLAVRQIVQNCYEETVKLVAENRACMDRVVDVLIEKESLDGDEFRALVGEFTAIPEKERFSPFISDGEVVSEAKAEPEAAQA